MKPDLLASEAKTNVFELLLELLEHRRAAEIERVATVVPSHSAPSLQSRMKAPLKQWLLKSMNSRAVPKDLTIVRDEIMSQDFLIYVLRHRPELPLDLFPQEDHELLRRFVRNKLMYGAVKVFDARDLLDHGYDRIVAEFDSSVRSGLNQPDSAGYVSFGFRTRESLNPIADFGSLLGHYGLREFADKVPAGEVFDAGPYIGDSAYVMAKYFPERRILCVEPDERNRSILMENIRLNGMSRAEVLPVGLGARAERLPCVLPGSSGTGAHAGIQSSYFMDVEPLDSLVERFEVKRVGLIKMDIEGQEMNALKGARRIITRDRPTLLVAIYHCGADLFEIPGLLREMVPDYQFAFRHLDPRCDMSEFVLVAF